MILAQAFGPKAIEIELESVDKDEVFEELVEVYVRAHPDSSREKLLEAIYEREQKMSTGILHGIAVPHARCETVKGVHGVIGISRGGIDYDSLDKAPVHLLFLIVSSPHDNDLHLRVLKRLAQLLSDPAFASELLEQKSPDAVLNVINRYEEMLSVV